VTNKVCEDQIDEGKRKMGKFVWGSTPPGETGDFVKLRQAKFCFRICDQKRLQEDYRNLLWSFQSLFNAVLGTVSGPPH
jgi:hypothetical protein